MRLLATLATGATSLTAAGATLSALGGEVDGWHVVGAFTGSIAFLGFVAYRPPPPGEVAITARRAAGGAVMSFAGSLVLTPTLVHLSETFAAVPPFALSGCVALFSIAIIDAVMAAIRKRGSA